jgi:CHAT domain-containing protein
MKTYADFEIQMITRDGRYDIAVHGHGGETDGRLALPLDDPAFVALRERITELQADELDMATFGQILFAALFQDRVRDSYAHARARLGRDQGLRLRLVIPPEAASVAALPWELLHDPNHGPLALLDMSVVRYLPQPDAPLSLETQLPLRVLLTAAQTPPPLAVERELAEVQAALAALGDRVTVAVEAHLTASILRDRLRQGCDIWHFVGHGAIARDGVTGLLLLEDERGDPAPISSLQLGILLNRCGLRLVVLDACLGARLGADALRSVAPALIRAQVPAVVAMQFPAAEEATRVFAREFYRRLADGLPIDACVTEGRRSLMTEIGLGRPDWAAPVVYTRAPDGRLFAPPAAPAPLPAVEDGIQALVALMRAPEVYGAVVAARDRFQAACRQIDVLSAYKGLHDRLQRVEDGYHLVDADRRRLAADPQAWSDLASNEPDLHDTVVDLLTFAASAVGTVAGTLWTRKLDRARADLRAAIEGADARLLHRAAEGLDDVLGSAPSQINARLVQVAAGLPLADLTRDLGGIHGRLAAARLDPLQVRQRDEFARSVAALAQLSDHLAVLVDGHNVFQALDDELRRIEVEADYMGELAHAWVDVRPMSDQLCGAFQADWTPRLGDAAVQLERALETPAAPQAQMLFWRYRKQVGQSFQRVDVDLLHLCEDLTRVGESIDLVLRTLAP